MKPEIAYVYNKLKQLRFDFHKTDFSDFRSNYRYEPTLNRYVRKDDNDLYISKDTFKPLEEELKYADKCHNLEEDLGCPLEILFKLVKQNKFYYEQDDELHLIVCFEIELRNGKIYFDESWLDHDIELGDFGTIELPLSDYKKLFWLKEDRSE